MRSFYIILTTIFCVFSTNYVVAICNNDIRIVVDKGVDVVIADKGVYFEGDVTIGDVKSDSPGEYFIKLKHVELKDSSNTITFQKSVCTEIQKPIKKIRDRYCSVVDYSTYKLYQPKEDCASSIIIFFSTYETIIDSQYLSLCIGSGKYRIYQHNITTNNHLTEYVTKCLNVYNISNKSPPSK